MVSLTFIALTAFAVAIYYYLFASKKKERYPPGPIGLPILGHLLSIGRVPQVAFDKWGKKYGGIFSVRMGTNPTIVITDLKLMREAMNDPAFSGRPDNRLFNALPGGKHGILNSDGDTWLEQRRFTLRNLRDFGFGKSSMESLVMDEVNDVIAWLKREEGKPVTLHRKLALSVLNALWTILTGERSDPDDKTLTNILDTANQTFVDMTKSGVSFFFPQMAEAFPNLMGWNKMLAAIKPLQDIFEKVVRDHEMNPNPDEDHPRDFVDVYMQEIKKTTNPASSFYKGVGRRSLVAVVGDLHGAGSETTSTTLSWSILYLLRHPDVQHKFQAEIDEVIGKSRLPTLADRAKMPYTEALLMEVMRLSTLVPTGLPHSTMVDTEFHGYKIPKDTLIIFNHYSAHYSVEIWGDPENFRPERFLTKSTSGSGGGSGRKMTVVRNEALVPFAVGKRACLGETLARDELFLFLTSILQRFDLLEDPQCPKPTMEPEIAFISIPKPYTVVMKDRIL